jgi:hypothetical protein
MNKVVSIILASVFFNFVRQLEKDCHCMDGWKRNFIKYYSLSIMVMNTVLLTGVSSSNELFTLVSTLLNLLGGVYIYTLFTYSKKLRKLNCTCSDVWQRQLMFYYSQFNLIVVLIVLSLTFVKTLGNFKFN